MSYLAPVLKFRGYLQSVVDVPADDGSVARSYVTIKEIWMGLKEVSSSALMELVRGEQVDRVETHEFIVRLGAVQSLGAEYALAFSTDWKSAADFNPVKSEYFIRLKERNGTGLSAGRRFKILRLKLDDEDSEFVKIRARYVEEVGTGWPV